MDPLASFVASNEKDTILISQSGLIYKRSFEFLDGINANVYAKCDRFQMREHTEEVADSLDKCTETLKNGTTRHAIYLRDRRVLIDKDRISVEVCAQDLPKQLFGYAPLLPGVWLVSRNGQMMANIQDQNVKIYKLTRLKKKITTSWCGFTALGILPDGSNAFLADNGYFYYVASEGGGLYQGGSELLATPGREIDHAEKVLRDDGTWTLEVDSKMYGPFPDLPGEWRIWSCSNLLMRRYRFECEIFTLEGKGGIALVESVHRPIKRVRVE